MLAVPEEAARRRSYYNYLVCVNWTRGPRGVRTVPRTVRQRLPRLRVPLTGGDPDVRLDLQAVLARTYDAGLYRDQIDYTRPCIPPLAPEGQAWADELIRSAPATDR